MLSVTKTRVLFSQGEETLAILPQPVLTTLMEDVLTISSQGVTLTLDLANRVFMSEQTPGTLDNYEIKEIRRLLKSDPDLKGHHRCVALRNKQGFPVAWVKAGVTGIDITRIRNTKFNRQQLALLAFKLGLKCSIPELRTMLKNCL